MPDKTKGTKERNLSLTPAELEHHQTYPLTFRPLSGGKFRCNQIDRFGRLSKAAVSILKGQLCRKRRSSGQHGDLATTVQLLDAKYSISGRQI